MRRRLGQVIGLGGAVACLACGAAEPTDTTGGSGGEGGAVIYNGPRVPLVVRLTDTLAAGQPSPVVAVAGPFELEPRVAAPWADVEVCLIEPPLEECGTTDAEGAVELSAPASARVAVRGSGGAMQTVIIQGTTDATEALALDAEVPSAEVIAAFNAVTGVPEADPDRGMIAFREVDDVTAAYFPQGRRLVEWLSLGEITYDFEAVGTYRIDSANLPAQQATGPAEAGGFVAGVPTGERPIRYDGVYTEALFSGGTFTGVVETREVHADCSTPVFGWPGEAPGEIIALVEPSTLTLTAAACTRTEAEVGVRVFDYVDSSVVMGAEVCLIEPAGPCARTDETGYVDVTVPTSRAYAVRVTAAGRLPTIAQSVSSFHGDSIAVPLPTVELFERFQPLVGPGPGEGVATIDTPAGGRVSADAEGATTVFLAEGVWFQPDPTLEASVGNPGWVGPLGAGEHVLHYEHDTRDCPKPTFGWPGDAPGDIVVLVEAGAVTLSGVDCPERMAGP